MRYSRLTPARLQSVQTGTESISFERTALTTSMGQTQRNAVPSWRSFRIAMEAYGQEPKRVSRRCRNPRFEIVHLPGPSNLDFGTVYLDTDDTLWVASRRLFRVRDGTATVFSLPEPHGAYVLNVIQDQARTLWLGTNGSGVFHVTPQGVRHYTTVANGLVNNFVRIMTEGRDGSIWIGTDAGVS